MRRGELYAATTPIADSRQRRVYLVVSRQPLLDSTYSTAVCVPVYSVISGLKTEVLVGPNEGLKHDSCARCDEVTSVPKVALRQYVGTLGRDKLRELDRALVTALEIDLDRVASSRLS